MKKKPIDLQNKIAATMETLNMKMGVFVAHGSIGQITFVRKDDVVWDAVLKDIKDSIEVAKRVNAKWLTVVPGSVDENGRDRLAIGYQTANVIELLRRCSDLLEPHGMVMVLEPLNWFTNHGGVFLQGSPQEPSTGSGLVDSYVANSILTQVPTYSVTEEQHLLAELRCATLLQRHRW